MLGVIIATIVSITAANPITKDCCRQQDSKVNNASPKTALDRRMDTDWNKFEPHEIDGKTYLFRRNSYSNSVKWEEAKQDCEDSGMELAHNLSPQWFKDAESNEKIRHYLWSSGYWVGARREGYDRINDWKWINGDALPATNPNWMQQPKEPRKDKDGMCVIVMLSSDDNYGIMGPWYAAFKQRWCGAKYFYICQPKA